MFLYNIFMTFDDAWEEEVDEETEKMKSLEKLQRLTDNGINLRQWYDNGM